MLARAGKSFGARSQDEAEKSHISHCLMARGHDVVPLEELFDGVKDKENAQRYGCRGREPIACAPPGFRPESGSSCRGSWGDVPADPEIREGNQQNRGEPAVPIFRGVASPSWIFLRKRDRTKTGHLTIFGLCDQVSRNPRGCRPHERTSEGAVGQATATTSRARAGTRRPEKLGCRRLVGWCASGCGPSTGTRVPWTCVLFGPLADFVTSRPALLNTWDVVEND